MLCGSASSEFTFLSTLLVQFLSTNCHANCHDEPWLMRHALLMPTLFTVLPVTHGPQGHLNVRQLLLAMPTMHHPRSWWVTLLFPGFPYSVNPLSTQSSAQLYKLPLPSVHSSPTESTSSGLGKKKACHCKTTFKYLQHWWLVNAASYLLQREWNQITSLTHLPLRRLKQSAQRCNNS